MPQLPALYSEQGCRLKRQATDKSMAVDEERSGTKAKATKG